MSDVPLPSDILAQILSWLPVTSLLRFRPVSKTLRALIDSDYVIHLHLTHSTQTNTNSNLIFAGDRTFSYLNLDSPTNAVNKAHNPLYFSIFETAVLGSCNGVVCLCTNEPDNEIALWNPAVRKFKKTRLAPAKCLEGVKIGVCVKGFGYDHVHDEYKVVRLVHYCGLFDEIEYSKIEVFSLKNEVWREIGDFMYHLCSWGYLNVYVNGALHWLVSRKPEGLMIAAFDLADEEVRIVPQPDFVNDKVWVVLCVLKGCLCMVCIYNHPKNTVDIWVMESYGVKESWSKLISTSDVKIVRELFFLRPIVCSKSGREVLLEKNFERLYWYHLEDKTVKRFKVAGMPRLFVTEMFTGSLVQVKIGNASQNVTKKEEDENKVKKKKDDFLSQGFRLKL